MNSGKYFSKTKRVILTEKPSVARDFAQALFDGKEEVKSGTEGHFENETTIITWSIGHLLTPYDPEDYDLNLKKWSLETLPIIPDKFKYKNLPQTKKQLEIVKKILRRQDICEIIIACDAGREGELIARLILNFSQVNPNIRMFRFWTSAALTKSEINNGLRNLKSLSHFDRLFVAGRARQIADWLVGMNLSRLATLKLGDLYSVGRVQTAVLGLLVNRRKSIDEFVPKEYWEFLATFVFKSEDNGFKKKLQAHWFDPKKKEEDKRMDRAEYFIKLNEVLKNKSATIIRLDEKEKTIYSTGLFSLTELQRQANIHYGLSANYTLELAQKLYERDKCLSYPRTDSRVMATSSYEMVRDLVFRFKETYPQLYTKFDESKVSLKNQIVFNDAKLTDHHGLVPLKEYRGNPNSDESKVFHLVLKQFISNFLKNHVYLETQLELKCEEEFFKASGKKILEIGFKILEQNEAEHILPNLKKGDIGSFVEGKVETKKTRPLPEYTEASLLWDMANPAKLVESFTHKKIFKGDIGLGTQATRAQIIETLLKRQYVEKSGRQLLVTKKGVTLVEKIRELPVVSDLTSVSQTAELELALEEMASGLKDDQLFLKEIEGFVSAACSEWKKCPEIKGVSEKTRPKFKEKSNFAKSLNLNCPLCSGVVNEFPKSYSCSRWKDGCKMTIWKVIAHKKISQKMAIELIENKKTHLLKGFKSKNGKSFDAKLTLNLDGKVSFDF